MQSHGLAGARRTSALTALSTLFGIALFIVVLALKDTPYLHVWANSGAVLHTRNHGIASTAVLEKTGIAPSRWAVISKDEKLSAPSSSLA